MVAFFSSRRGLIANPVVIQLMVTPKLAERNQVETEGYPHEESG